MVTADYIAITVVKYTFRSIAVYSVIATVARCVSEENVDDRPGFSAVFSLFLAGTSTGNEDEHYSDKSPLVNTSCNNNRGKENEEVQDDEEVTTASGVVVVVVDNNRQTTESTNIIVYSNNNNSSSNNSSNSCNSNNNSINKTRLNQPPSSLDKFYKRHCIYSYSPRHNYNNENDNSNNRINEYRLYLNNHYYYNAFRHYYKKNKWLAKHKKHCPSFWKLDSKYLIERLKWCHTIRQKRQKRLLLGRRHYLITTEQQPEQQQIDNTTTTSITTAGITTSSTTTKIDDSQVWFPPINAYTLEELSVSHMFKSLQLRHDLLSDPHLYFRPNLDGPSGREKRKRADRYWKRVDRAFLCSNGDYDFVRIIIRELVKILVTLIKPFDNSTLAGFRWSWPEYITAENLVDLFDADLMIQQLTIYGSLDGCTKQVECLVLIFNHLCPIMHQSRIELMRHYFAERAYAKALRQCFIILEIIKLDCANHILRHYRNLLIGTCAEFEYQYFVKQYDASPPHYIKSVYQWLKTIWQTQGRQQSFESIYYHGLVHLVSDDEETIRALSLPLQQQFPITLKFDERRMTHQFRYEFQNMIVISILMVPYRHLATDNNSNNSSSNNHDNMIKLKQTYTTLLKSNNSCYHQLALHACETANRMDQVDFWEEWLSQNLLSSSAIFRLMYHRICQQLVYYVQYGTLENKNNHLPFTGMEDEIAVLGTKLKAIAKLNLDVFGDLYRNVAKELLSNDDI